MTAGRALVGAGLSEDVGCQIFEQGTSQLVGGALDLAELAEQLIERGRVKGFV